MQDFRVLCLNCQKGYHPAIKSFLESALASNLYDFLLLQEADEKIAAMIEGFGSSYKSLSRTNDEVQRMSHLRIMYRNDFELKDNNFISFANMNRLFAQKAELGFLTGTFVCNGETITVGSVHLHPGISLRIRRKEMAMIKNKLATYTSTSLRTPMIFGGDFNSGPSENAYIKKFFAPQFADTCLNIGPTLNSRYTERGPHHISKIANVLAKLGINITFKTDHILIDKATAEQCVASAVVLPDRVSDHSPIELTLSSKTATIPPRKTQPSLVRAAR